MSNSAKLIESLEASNRLKYGEKEYDQISDYYRVKKEHGDVWCIGNIRRYLDRFVRPGSSKANNLTDLYKCKDYLERMIAENEKALEDPSSGVSAQEVIENFKQ